MIKKIIELKNIGVFRNLRFDDSRWNKEFKKVNLIFSRNGQGKTTLTEIMNSLKNSDTDLIKARQTLGQSENPKLKLLIDGNVVTFENNSWSSSYEKIEIFNSKFIYDNLYTGESVETGHQKNLHSFIIGSTGVELTRDIIDIDSLIKNIGTQITNQKNEIASKINGYDFDEFIALINSENIDSIIKQIEKDIEIQSRKDQIAKKQELDLIQITLPKFEVLGELLGQSYANISKLAEEKIRVHASENCNGKIHKFIQEGLKVYNGKTCPFCGQNATANELLKYYQDYFNLAYQEYRERINSSLKDIAGSIENQRFAGINLTDSKNQQLHEYWQEIISELPHLEKNVQFIHDNLQKVEAYIIADISLKKENILDSLQANKEIEFFLDQVVEELAKYNLAVKKINEQIKIQKENAKQGNLSVLTQKKKESELTKLRHNDETVIAMCINYKYLNEEKKRLANEKILKRKALDQYCDAFMSEFKDELNKQLERFGAGYRIMSSVLDYKGGQPKVDYKLEINRCEVPLRASKSYVPSFKNTLSEGDKTTLAFAFFVCKLKKSPDISEKIIVVDDPITSLDFFRITQTVAELNRLAVKARQTFLFTHNEILAKKFYDVAIKNNYDFYELEIKASCLRRLDIDSITSIDYFKNYSILDNYLNGSYDGEEISVARCVRPLLEGYLRVRFPKDFKSDKWLGDFIGIIRQSNNVTLSNLFTELDDLNEYSKRFHHEDGGVEPIDSNELRGFVSRTLNFLSI
ncbi:AAA family ATPase [Paenibacillus sp. OSY-SE]|uniref:AAA family ATPase n=1 Tax=Paenibacillus sp. OSY-SE TaxID=1196323 RepID=UPI00031A77E7|nr:AAA family ATPase [Paenibacillus sp. OSY-SE]